MSKWLNFGQQTISKLLIIYNKRANKFDANFDINDIFDMSVDK